MDTGSLSFVQDVLEVKEKRIKMKKNI